MEEIIFDETSEEYKAIQWLKNKTTNYSDDSLVLHYNNILYYLIINLMKKNEKLENVILGLECDVEILSEQIEDDCTAHEEANKYYTEAQELSIRINEAIEYIHSKEYQYGDLEQDVYDYDMGFDEVEDLLKILKGED